MNSRHWHYPLGTPPQGVMMVACGDRIVAKGEIPALERLKFVYRPDIRMVDIVTPDETRVFAIFTLPDGDPVEVETNGDTKVQVLDKGDDVARWLTSTLGHPSPIRLVLLPFSL